MAVVTGKGYGVATTNLGFAPKRINNVIYVLLSSIVEAFEKDISWNPATKRATITDEPKYLESLDGSYLLNIEDGRLYRKAGNKLFEVGKVSLTIKESAKMNAIILTNQNVLLNITDNYGEPHIANDVSMIFLKNNKILHFTTTHYWSRFEENIILFRDNVIMTDGQKVYLVNKVSGNIMKIYDLPSLTGKADKDNAHDNWFTEGIGENYLLVRQNRDGLLTLIKLSTKERVDLYKIFFADDRERLVHAKTNDIPYYGDYLHLIKEKDNVLFFRDDNPFLKNDKVYQYKL